MAKNLTFFEYNPQKALFFYEIFFVSYLISLKYRNKKKFENNLYFKLQN
jgi:hypothetical protein